MEGKYIRWLKVPPGYDNENYINNDFVDKITEWRVGYKKLEKFRSIHHKLRFVSEDIYECHDGFFRIYDTKEQALDPPYDFKVGDKVKLIPELEELYENYETCPIDANEIYTVFVKGSFSWGVGFQKCILFDLLGYGWIPQECFTRVQDKPFETHFNVGDTVRVVDEFRRYPHHSRAYEYGCVNYAGDRHFPETLTIKKLLYINDTEPGAIITDGEWDWLIAISGIAKVDVSIPEDPYKVFKDAIASGKIVQCKNKMGEWWEHGNNWNFDSPPEKYRIKPKDPKKEPVMESKLPDWVFPGVIFWEKNNHNAIRTVVSVEGNSFKSTIYNGQERLYDSVSWSINEVHYHGYEPMPYDLAQQRWIETRGIKVGDTVRVVRRCESKFLGWSKFWISIMEIGMISKIIGFYGTSGIFLESGFKYPYFCLEKVESATEPEEVLSETKAVDNPGKYALSLSELQVTHTEKLSPCQPKLQDLFTVTPDSVQFKLDIVKEKIINL